MKKRLLIWFKTWLAKYTLIIEFCLDCGVKQPLVWHASNDLWMKVMKHSGGVVCPTCFDKRAEAQGLLLDWTPAVFSVQDKEVA